MLKLKNLCPLCTEVGVLIYKNKNKYFYKCKNCLGVFSDEFSKPNLEEEKLIYTQHKNNVDDINYQKFVSPITLNILKEFSSISRGLDFGAGSGPVITKVLSDKNYTICSYDPIFHQNKELLNKNYDYIASCEVIEHFHYPYKEFKLLKSILNLGGKLYCMTEIYNDSIDFSSWYYKNDPSHVFFYTKSTLEWIKEEFGFVDVKIEGRLIVFSN